jgi:hypothetical protein
MDWYRCFFVLWFLGCAFLAKRVLAAWRHPEFKADIARLRERRRLRKAARRPFLI